MDKELKATWVEALRSGKYKQGKFYLYDRDKNTYCCLGVLGCLLGQQLDAMEKQGDLDAPIYEPILQQIGNTSIAKNLAFDLNDSAVWSFSKIADHIEKNL